MKSSRKLLREIFAETNDPVVTIRAVREQFGLSIDEVRQIWLEATGTPVSLTAHEEALAAVPLRIICPKCHAPGHVERKIHALPPWLAFDGSQAMEAPGPRFINGFWCKACEVGFVPDHLLRDLGLEKIR